ISRQRPCPHVARLQRHDCRSHRGSRLHWCGRTPVVPRQARLDEWNERITEIPEESLEAVDPEPRKKRITKRKKKPGHRQPHAPEDRAPQLDVPEGESR